MSEKPSYSEQKIENNSCLSLKGVGEKLAQRLQKLGITTIQDILFHLPSYYQDRTRITPLANVRAGDKVLIEGSIGHVSLVRRGRRMLLCRLWDGTASITLCFFYFNYSQQQRLVSGARLRCFGEIRSWRGKAAIVHPEYQHINSDEIVPVAESLTPVYPTTEGIQQKTWYSLTKQALTCLDESLELKDYLPQEILCDKNYPNLKQALHYIHRPPPDADTGLLKEGKHLAQQRLVLEELLTQHLCLLQQRQKIQQHKAPALQLSAANQVFIKNLPFVLTSAQQRVSEEVAADLQRSHPMLRLIQGDVGSGKTIIAALAALQTVGNAYQAVLMAPTELLAEQHYNNFLHWFAPFNITVAWLSGSVKAKQRRETLAVLANGEAQIIIGTHALFQQDVEFHKLGLIIVDEQHRFGVAQRLALREKGQQVAQDYPHQLIMSATPIPRTLAMTVYADLDNSIIDELPPGRLPVTTVAIDNQKRDEVITRVRENCRHGQQVYWVCTLIEESEVLQCQAAEDTAKELQRALPKLKVQLIHGRLKAKEKEQIMQAFKQGFIDVLVATTVIEVGVDVPNANLMVIENPERLGLAQLHQLRGRVGRGSDKAFCVLLYQAPLSGYAKSRIEILRSSNDGFVIAQRDLELRGSGEVLGTRQTGIAQLRIADIIRDQYLLPETQKLAELMIKSYDYYIPLLIKRWLGRQTEYGKV